MRFSKLKRNPLQVSEDYFHAFVTKLNFHFFQIFHAEVNKIVIAYIFFMTFENPETSRGVILT